VWSLATLTPVASTFGGLDWVIDRPPGEPTGAGEPPSDESLGREAEVRTFLIADIRGYTRFTEERGDEAAARLAARFASVIRESVGTRGGVIVEVRGDEALAVFGSARQALRAAVELQVRFEDENRADPDLPLNVGIGIDSGEAVRIDGGFRGAALNIAARLCGLAHTGEVIATDSVVHLAGRLEGIRYVDRGRVHLKGISEPVRILELRRELSPVQGASWSWRPLDWSKALGWRLVLGVSVIAAVTAGVVVLLTTRGPSGGAAPAGSGTQRMQTGGMAMENSRGKTLTPTERLKSYARGRPWSCHDAKTASAGALASLVCRTDVADRLQLTLFRSRGDLERAYSAEVQQAGVPGNTGSCRAGAWRGEVEWSHGIGEAGGRAFCYLSEATQRSYLTWTSEAGAKVLAVAQLDSLLHRRLFFWWVNVRHEIV
jgi:class 3 adenylate cyclase